MNLDSVSLDLVILLSTALGSVLRLGIMYVWGKPHQGWRKQVTKILIVSVLAHAVRALHPVCEAIDCYINPDHIDKVKIDHNLLYGIFTFMGLLHTEIIDLLNSIYTIIKEKFIEKIKRAVIAFNSNDKQDEV